MSLKTKFIMVEKQVTESLSCDNCNSDIPLVTSIPALTTQGREALRVILDGGYGMFIDLINERNGHDFLFCKECAEKLVKQYPCFYKAIYGE